jgi:hypothetical protein
MGNKKFEPREHGTKACGNVVDAFHARDDIKHLPPTIQFLSDGTSYGLWIEGG